MKGTEWPKAGMKMEKIQLLKGGSHRGLDPVDSFSSKGMLWSRH